MDERSGTLLRADSQRSAADELPEPEQARVCTETGRHEARVKRKCVDSGAGCAPGEFANEHDRLELARAIGQPSTGVGPPPPVEVIEVEPREHVGTACSGDHPAGAPGDAVEQQVREQEWREVVVLECAFVTIRRFPPGTDQAAGVVREHVDARVARQQFLCEGAHFSETVEVCDERESTHLIGNGTGAFRIAPHDGDCRTPGGQCNRRGATESRTRPRDHDDPAAQFCAGSAHR